MKLSGIKADPKNVATVQNFTDPNNIKDLRSFLAIVNQLRSFSHTSSGAIEPLRELSKNKRSFYGKTITRKLS